MNNKFNLLNSFYILSLCFLVWSISKSMELNKTNIVQLNSASQSYDNANFFNKFIKKNFSLDLVWAVRKYFTKNTIPIMNLIVEKKNMNKNDVEKFINLYERCLRYGTGIHKNSEEFDKLKKISRNLLIKIHPDKNFKLDTKTASLLTAQIIHLRNYAEQKPGATLKQPTSASILCIQAMLNSKRSYESTFVYEHLW